MKRSITLSASLVLGVMLANAQITLQSYDVVVAGNVLHQANDTIKSQMVGGLNPGASGGNATWDFTNLLVGNLDTLLITNPAWTPNGPSFPASNLAGVSTDGTAFYLINTGTGLYIDGAYGDFTGQGAVKVNFNPNELMIPFPNTIGNSVVNTSEVIISAPFASPPFDSIRIKEIKTKNMVTDGWGTVKTPLGNYPSLRQRSKVVTHDSIWAHSSITGWAFFTETLDSNWHFSWWAKGVGLPIIEFDSTEADTIRNINWLKTVPVPGAVNENPVLGSIKAYPNPSAGKVNVSVPASVKEYTAEIYSATGEKLTGLLAGKDGSMDLSGLPNGIYFLRITSGKDIITRKIVLNR